MKTINQRSLSSKISNGGSDDVPPSGRRRRRDDEPPPPMSHFAIRHDGFLLLSIEDADDRDLEGRQLQTFLVLRSDEAALAREVADDGISAAAAHVIGRLPKK